MTYILTNKRKDMTPFNMAQKPIRQNPLLLPLIWIGSYLATRKFHLKIEKKGMQGLKPPYLVFSTHQGFADYYIGPLCMFPHRANYVSDMEGFAAFGKSLYRGIGCIGKRRYVSDANVIYNMKYALSRKQSVVIFPESRHSNVGTTAYIGKNLGKLAKLLNVPVVTISANGSYLNNPFWNEEETRKVPIKVAMKCICDISKLHELDELELQNLIEEKLTYDEYDYQHKAGFTIEDQDRAEGIEHALYQCKNCGKPYHMKSKGTLLWCDSCKSQWELTHDGWLQNESGEKLHIPDWYEWQRKNVIYSLQTNKDTQNIHREYKVSVEALPNEHGFIKLGEGYLVLNRQEFRLMFTTNNEKYVLVFPHKTRESVQTEYNYRNRGACIVLSTKDCCYYLYSQDDKFCPTELQFIGEYLHHGGG